MPPEKSNSIAPPFLQGGGKMGDLMRSFPWEGSAFGNPDKWPAQLATSVNILLRSKLPMLLLWGTDCLVLHNDAFRLAMNSHSDSLAAPAHLIFSDLWKESHPAIQSFFDKPDSDDQLTLKIPFCHQQAPDAAFRTFSFSPLVYENGNTLGLLGISTETSELTDANTRPGKSEKYFRDLEESETRFKMMILQSPIAIGLTRGKDLIIDCINQPMLQLLGKSEDIIGKPMLVASPELEGKESYLRMQEVFATGIPFHAKEIPEYFNNPEGEVHYFNLSCTPVFEGEKVIATLQVAIDVTSEVMAKKKIREAEAKARLAIESADLGTYEVDLVTNELKASERFQMIWGLPGNLSRAAFEARIHPDDVSVRQRAFKDAYITGNLFYEARITLPGSGERWLRTQGKMFFDEKNMPTYLIGISQDITKQKLFTEELEKEVRERTAEMERKNQELEDINQRLEQFNYAASHDMQEPLRKVTTFTSFLLEEHAAQLDEEGKIYLEKISISSQRMKTIIDDLLNYSQQSRGETPFSPVDLNDVLKGVEADLELMIMQKQAEIAIANLPQVMALPGQLQQLFLNLVNNALKFADAERPLKIVIEWEIPDAELLIAHHLNPNKKHVHVTVSDNGIGFEPQYAQSIFELFRRLHSKNRYEGSGIGLGLCKKIVQQHNGAIWAESTPGAGATFHLLLPEKQESSRPL